MTDLEEQCEDAVLEVCDARERYPTLCANELLKILKHKNELCMARVKKKPSKSLEIQSLAEEQECLLKTFVLERKAKLATKSNNMEEMLDDIRNLMDVHEQIEREKSCPFIALLNS